MPEHLGVSLEQIAARLGGKVRSGKGGPDVAAPGPGHSAKDDSLTIRIDPSAPDGFLVHSFSDKDRDALFLKDYVRKKANLPPFKPKKVATCSNGSRPVPSAEIAAKRAAATARAAAALSKQTKSAQFIGGRFETLKPAGRFEEAMSCEWWKTKWHHTSSTAALSYWAIQPPQARRHVLAPQMLQ